MNSPPQIGPVIAEAGTIQGDADNGPVGGHGPRGTKRCGRGDVATPILRPMIET